MSHAVPALFHISFYKFVALPDAEACASRLRALTEALTGSILVAPEGINGMLAGPAAALDAFEQAMREEALFAGRFADVHFKRSACVTPPFARMKVHLRREVLPLGFAGVDALSQSEAERSLQLSPAAWRELIAQDDVVLIDNRNSFEYRLGRFRGAIDPQVNNFRDFPHYIDAKLEHWKAAGKRVAMYCTGGIRCEKTAVWLRDKGLPVYQLEGGILNYFEQMPDAEHDWQGECFVFDNRVAIDSKLQETATRAEQVYGDSPDERWRLARAQRLASDAEGD